MVDDAELLRQYSRTGAEPAFTEFVRRHLNVVYFAALRRTLGDAPLAQDVTQAVFAIAARKAGRLAGHGSLTGWMYMTTRNLAAKAMRKEETRRHYENLAATDASGTTEPSSEWERLRPVIDEVLDEMPAADREAILVRFFQGRSYPDMGAALKISGDAARMRLERALEKLRRLLERRGIRSAAGALASALSAQGALAAPIGMAAAVSSAAITAAGGVAGTMAFLATMSLSKTTAIAASMVAALTTVLSVFERSRAHDAETRLASINRDHMALQASLARAESLLLQARFRADEADRDSASLLAAVEAARKQASQPTQAVVATASPPADDMLARTLDAIFPDGIVATMGNKMITVAEIREKIAHQLPGIQAAARDTDELCHRLNQLQNAAIKEAVDRILLVKEFSNEKASKAPRQISPVWVDHQVAEIMNAQFANDATKLATHLQSRGVTLDQFRAEIEDTIAYNYMRQQQRKLDGNVKQSNAR